MKVLYIGVYRDGTGWGQAAIDYILALDAAGVDVVCRPLKLNDAKPEPPKRILELEAKSSRGCDHVIQHVLPHQMDYCGKMKKNIGLFVSETSNFSLTGWPGSLNTMDQVWVVNRQMVNAADMSGVTSPIKLVPHATDTTKFERNYQTPEQIKHLEGTFKFYFIGEFGRRKNLAALLKAFHVAFDPSEPVSLIIKTTGDRDGVRSFCDEIKKGLKLFNSDPANFKQECIITERLSNEQICGLHYNCDCFVMPSYGEAWCIPAFDAMGFGKTPIAARFGGIAEYLDDKVGWPVAWQPDVPFGMFDSLADIYTADEWWASVSVPSMVEQMRKAYQDKEAQRRKSLSGMERVYDYSYEAIGLVMSKALSDEQATALAGTPTGKPDGGG